MLHDAIRLGHPRPLVSVDVAGLTQLHELGDERPVGEELGGVQKADPFGSPGPHLGHAIGRLGAVLPIEGGHLGDQVLPERYVVALVHLGQDLQFTLRQGHPSETDVGNGCHPAPVDQLAHFLHHRLVTSLADQHFTQRPQRPRHAGLPHAPGLQIDVRVPGRALRGIHQLQCRPVAPHLVERPAPHHDGADGRHGIQIGPVQLTVELTMPSVGDERLVRRVAGLQLGQPCQVGITTQSGRHVAPSEVPRLRGDPLGGQEQGHQRRMHVWVDQPGHQD